MTKSYSKSELVKHMLQDLLPEKAPTFAGYSLNDLVFLATYEDYPNCYVRSHDSPFHTLELIDDSSINLHNRRIGDRKMEIPLSSGQMYFIPQQADYFLEVDDPNQNLSFTLMALCPDALRNVARERFHYDDEIEFKLEEPKAFDLAAEEIQIQVNLIKRQILSGYSQGEEYLQILIETLMVLLIRRFAVSPRKFKEIHPNVKRIAPVNTRRLEAVKEYIKDHLHEKIFLEDLAKNLDLGLNSFGVSRLFSQLEGITFVAYLTKARVEKAMELLIETHDPIAEIAQKCQFHDTSHLCRKFKSLTNLTPTQYRKEYGGKKFT
jgi:AraC-like DNA-binding protein